MANRNAVEVVYATPPYRAARRSAGTALARYLGLTRVMLKEYRSSWFIHTFFSAVMPLGMLFLFKYAFGGSLSPEQAVFLLGGNLTTSLVYGPTMMLINRIGWGRHNRDFDYWAALPVPKLALVLAMLTVALVLALPGLAGILAVGTWLLGLPYRGLLGILLTIPFATLSIAGFGAFIGAYAKDGQTASSLANIFMGFVTFLSPTMVPLEQMPTVLRWVAVAFPTTYASDAFRNALSGNFGTGLAYDVLILGLYSLAFLVLVQRKLDWRAG